MIDGTRRIETRTTVLRVTKRKSGALYSYWIFDQHHGLNMTNTAKLGIEEETRQACEAAKSPHLQLILLLVAGIICKSTQSAVASPVSSKSLS